MGNVIQHTAIGGNTIVRRSSCPSSKSVKSVKSVVKKIISD